MLRGKTLKETYENIFHSVKNSYLSHCLTEDKANRKANIYAVKNTYRIHNEKEKNED